MDAAKAVTLLSNTFSANSAAIDGGTMQVRGWPSRWGFGQRVRVLLCRTPHVTSSCGHAGHNNVIVLPQSHLLNCLVVSRSVRRRWCPALHCFSGRHGHCGVQYTAGDRVSWGWRRHVCGVPLGGSPVAGEGKIPTALVLLPSRHPVLPPVANSTSHSVQASISSVSSSVFTGSTALFGATCASTAQSLALDQPNDGAYAVATRLFNLTTFRAIRCARCSWYDCAARRC